MLGVTWHCPLGCFTCGVHASTPQRLTSELKHRGSFQGGGLEVCDFYCILGTTLNTPWKPPNRSDRSQETAPWHTWTKASSTPSHSRKWAAARPSTIPSAKSEWVLLWAGWSSLLPGPRWISIKIPMVETPCSHYGEIGIHPCSGNGDPACCTGWPKN